MQITSHSSRTPNSLHNAAPNQGHYNSSSQYQLLTNSFHYRSGSQNLFTCVESSWNVMAHGDAREGKWRGNWRMEWVASTLHTTSEHGVSSITTAEGKWRGNWRMEWVASALHTTSEHGVPSITTADAHTSAASSRLNWRPCRFKWSRPVRRKTKSGFCACAITFQTQSTRWQPISLNCALHINKTFVISGFHLALLQSITFISRLNALDYTKPRR